jgi:hypothetical protein
MLNTRKLGLRLLLWSWLITLPIAIGGGYLSYKTLTRFYTFQVRYDPYPAQLKLHDLLQYEWGSMLLAGQAAINRYLDQRIDLKSIYLFASQSELARLGAHLPQSGFKYIKAAVLHKQKLIKAKIRYRGDFSYHWAWNKKSLRVKTSKNHLYHGLRRFNLLAPQFAEQLNNYLAYQLAGHMGLLVPRTELLRVFLNGEDRGVHVLVEQLSEMTLRHNKLMPSDIYRGELYGKDAYTDGGAERLFDAANLWDKVAVNNHYPAEAKKPLERLIKLLQDPDDPAKQEQLSALLDMQAWARFSLFESLIQSWHYDDYHNWRLTYDPWTQKLAPIVWDPIGWAKGWFVGQEEQVEPIVISSKLHKALFKNGDFLRARYRVAQTFFTSEKESEFLAFMQKTINIMQQAIMLDPMLNKPNINLVGSALQALKLRIEHIFTALKRDFMSGEVASGYQYIPEGQLNLWLADNRIVQRLKLSFAQPLQEIPKMHLSYAGSELDLTNALTLTQHQVQVNTQFLPGKYQLTWGANSLGSSLVDIMLDYGQGWESVARMQKMPDRMIAKPQILKDKLGGGQWQIFYNTGQGFHEQQSKVFASPIKLGVWLHPITLTKELKAIRVDLPADSVVRLSDIRLKQGDKSVALDISELQLHDLKQDKQGLVAYGNTDAYFVFAIDSLPLNNSLEAILTFKVAIVPNKIYKPVALQSLKSPLIWSGEVKLKGLTIIDRPLIIKPGTRILFAEQASLIIKNRLLAIGSQAQPIQFIAQDKEQLPWGAVAITGVGANESVLSYCHFSGGSGLQSDLYEYTAMLSIHNTEHIQISDSVFADNHLVDDMLHIIYARVDLQRNQFRNAFADALDIDISSVTVSDSVFIGSGNDAVDLMNTDISIVNSTFIGNGDKGISVGEGSRLLAVNNLLRDNVIGIQAKDSSIALMFNQSLLANQTALAAYKKNWRYGSGGLLILAKSILEGNGVNLLVEKQSKAYLFDSAITGGYAGKRIKSWAMGDISIKGQSALFLPLELENLSEVADFLIQASDNVLAKRNNQRRGVSR